MSLFNSILAVSFILTRPKTNDIKMQHPLQFLVEFEELTPKLRFGKLTKELVEMHPWYTEMT